MKFMSFLFLAMMVSFQAHADVNIAVIDSGVDIKHEKLVNKMWINEKENPTTPRDDDGNDYPNDIHGWNFAESNNQLIDYVYSSVYENADVFKFFEIQKKQFLMRATSDDLAWVESKRKDKKFMSDLSVFGNFVHGTHVSGITTTFAKSAKVIGIKLLPTKSPLNRRSSSTDSDPSPRERSWGGAKNPPKDGGTRIELLKKLLDQVALLNSQNLLPIGHYVNWSESEVANGSFGLGSTQAKMIVGILYKIFFFRQAKEEELMPLMKYFLQAVVKAQKSFVSVAPDTLFVFAAGNDGTDNDILPSAPASVGGDNVISVAASFGNTKLAKFSNFGKTTVDVAAPGVFIHSSIPLNRYMEVSGTSQASPRVAAVAAHILEINSRLSPADVKKIIMSTVDVKDFLKDKVVSGGIVNAERAAFAASYSRKSSLDEALIVAKVKVKDAASFEPNEKKGSSLSGYDDSYIYPLDMPTGFDLESFTQQDIK